MTSKKKNSKNVSSVSKNRKAKRIAEENKKRLHNEISAIVLFVCGIFFIVAMHSDLAGTIGEYISSLLKGSFGIIGFVLPYFLIIYGYMLFSKMEREARAKIMVLLSVVYFMIVLLNAGRFLETFDNVGIIEVFKDSVRLKSGGIFGMYIGYFLKKAIGITGLYLLSISIIIIALLLIVNMPISKAYEDAKAKQNERKKKKAESAEVKNNIDISKDYIIKEKVGSQKKSGNKKSILNLLKNDENYGLKNEDNPDSNIIVENKNDNVHKIFEKNLEREKATNEDEKVEVQIEEKMVYSDMTSNYELPSINILEPAPKKTNDKKSGKSLQENAKTLEETLKSFNVEAKVINVTEGSSVTRYEIQPSIGVKVASIVRLADDIALNLRAKSIRIEAPIPGKAAVGIEVENEKREMVTISELISSSKFKQNPSKLAFVVGKDIGGKPVVADLAKMPHMLIAGATGSGKSVCVNAIIASILYRATPNEVKLLLIDPKMVELGNYNGIPHLLIPVVTDSSKAAAALNWAVAEMTERYKKFAKSGVRDIKAYNLLQKKNKEEEEVLPQIVIVIDELADLMMVASSQVEDAICRLAQLARAAGIHLIVATQRPSVDVVTGLIKANIPSRVAFMVSSQIDSRTIIDMPGAEKLVGNGDMLYKPQDLDKPMRVQGPFISDREVKGIIEHVKSQMQDADYDEEIITHIEKGDISKPSSEDDELLSDAIELVIRAKQASVSMLQRRFRIGYNRAARLIDDMEDKGIVGPQDGSRGRNVLVTEEELVKRNIEGDD